MENKKNVKWSDLNKSAKFFVISITFFVCVVFMILVTELFNFGGLVINKVIATVDIDGNVLTMRLAE